MIERRSVAILSSCFCVLAVGPAVAAAQTTTRSQSDPRPSAHATLREGEITIDGRLDDAAWAKATPITELVQAVPDEGKPPSQRTEIRILYDAAAIYIGARMYDSLGAKGVRTALARRDQVMNGNNSLTSDHIAFVFDTFRDKNSRTWFELNPSGVKGDHQNGDASYDPVWESATKIDSLGWTAEFRIPFSQLRFFARSRSSLGNADLAHHRSPQRAGHVGVLGAATSTADQPISVPSKE